MFRSAAHREYSLVASEESSAVQAPTTTLSRGLLRPLMLAAGLAVCLLFIVLRLPNARHAEALRAAERRADKAEATLRKGAVRRGHRELHRAGSDAQLAADWWLPGEAEKKGAGLLFFAYGGYAQVDHFLKEASAAALSIRELNPTINIGVVSNNATVDRFIFSHHVTPRADLLFPGSDCPDACRPDKLPRQWTTRLYYMALSPFEITWAMDSNVYACPSPWALNAVHAFLREAERSALWGYDIAHANSADGAVMFPHCFDMIWRWTPRYVALVPGWNRD